MRETKITNPEENQPNQGGSNLPTLSPERYRQLKLAAQSMGINPRSLAQNVNDTIRQVNPYQEQVLGKNYDLSKDWVTYEQSTVEDFTSALFNGLVIEGGKGLGNLIPTIAQAATNDHLEWASSWSKSLDTWFDAQKAIYSDEANNPIDDFGDITGSHVATALGQGVGFILGIAGGGNVAKGISTAAKLSSKGVTNAQRIGTYMAGTTLMYPMVKDEALQAGIDETTASRLALGISGIISLTEGAALEWVGKSITSGVVNNATRKGIREQLKNLSVKTLDEQLFAQKQVAKGIFDKIKKTVPQIAKGSAVEFGQEFSQTYIEDGIKQMYDAIYASDKEVGKGKFGADTGIQGLFGYDYDKDKAWTSFVESSFGGFIGGLLGGAIPGVGGLRGGIETEAMYGYIQRNVAKGKQNKIEQLYGSLEELKKSGDLNENQFNEVKSQVAGLVKFAQQTKGLNIEDQAANYQLYQINQLSGKTQKTINDRFKIDDTMDVSVKERYEEQKKAAESLLKNLKGYSSVIAATRQPLNRDKQAFEHFLKNNAEIGDDIFQNKKSVAEVEEALKNVSPENKHTHYYADIDQKYVVTDTYLENKDKVKQILDLGKSEETVKAIKDQFDMDFDVAKMLIDEENLAEAFKDGELKQVNIKEIQKSPAKELTPQEIKFKTEELQVLENELVNEGNLKEGFNQARVDELTTKIAELKSELGVTEQANAQPEVSSIKYKDVAYEVKKNQDGSVDILNTVTGENITPESPIGRGVISALEKQPIKTTKEQSEKEDVVKSEKPQQKLKDFVGKRVRYKDIVGVLLQEEDGTYTIEIGNRIYDFGKNGNQLLSQLDIEETVDIPKSIIQYNISNVTEKTVEVNGEIYEIQTDKNGNVISLKNNNRTIRSTKAIIPVEIERNRLERNNDTREENELNESIQKEFNISFDEVTAIDNLLDENLTDEIANVLNNGLPKNTTLELLQKLDYYIENASNLLMQNFPNSEYAESLIDGLIELQEEINEEYNLKYKPKKDARKEQKSEDVIEEQLEKVSSKKSKKRTKKQKKRVDAQLDIFAETEETAKIESIVAEAKKADIEKRRQEAKNNIKLRPKLDEALLRDKEELERTGKVDNRASLALKQMIKNQEDKIDKEYDNIILKEFGELEFKKTKILRDKKNLEKYFSKDPTTDYIELENRKKRIAKYDAELKALEENTTNQSEIEAKKADIERRRQEDLEQLKVILPIGTSGSGKSTFIKSLPQKNLVIIEPDAMRVEFTGDMNDKSKDKEIYIEAANRAIQAIKQGKQVVFDTTNLTKDKRLPFIEAIKKALPNANIQYKLMELNPELAKQRIKAQIARGENRANVSDETIDRHAESYKQMLKDIQNEPLTEFKTNEEINAKYDAELKALEENTTNQSETEAKIAEIERRRQEELNAYKNYKVFSSLAADDTKSDIAKLQEDPEALQKELRFLEDQFYTALNEQDYSYADSLRDEIEALKSAPESIDEALDDLYMWMKGRDTEDLTPIINAKYDAELKALEETSGIQEAVPFNEEIVFEKKGTTEVDETVLDEEKSPSNDIPLPNDLPNFFGDTKEQRKDKNQPQQSLAYQTIKGNEELYNKFLNHFKKIFPFMTVERVNELGKKHGIDVLGQVLDTAIKLDKDKAMQGTLAHEFAHVYVDMLGLDNALVKAGLEFIKTTLYYNEAQANYPDLTNDEQAMEALVEAISIRSIDKLAIKLEGSKLDKFMAWMKQFWNRIKSFFTMAKGKDIVEALSDAMVYRKRPFKGTSNVKGGIAKDQRYNAERVKKINSFQGVITASRLNYILNPNVDINVKSPEGIMNTVLSALYNSYISGKQDYMFETFLKGTEYDVNKTPNYDFENKRNESILEYRGEVNKFISEYRAKNPADYAILQSMATEISKRPIKKDVKYDITNDEGLDGNEDDKGVEGTGSAVKIKQKISESLRAVMAGIVDNDGKLISADRVEEYVASVAQKSDSLNSFRERVRKDTDKYLEAQRINALLDSLSGFPQGRLMVNGILTEMSSLMQIPFYSVNVITDKETKKVESRRKYVNRSKSDIDYINNLIKFKGKLPEFDRKFLFNITKSNNEADLIKMKSLMEELFNVQMNMDEFQKWLNGNFAKSGINYFYTFYLPKALKSKNVKQISSDIGSYLRKLDEILKDNIILQKSFVNSFGNRESSTRFSYELVDVFNRIINNKNYRETLLQNPLFKNNPVINFALKNGKLNWGIVDALKYDDEVLEYSKMTPAQLTHVDLVNFAGHSGKDSYFQKIGISNDRPSAFTVEVPRLKTIQEMQNAVNELAKINNIVFQEEKAKGRDVKKLEKILTSTSLLKVENGNVVSVDLLSDKSVKQKIDKVLNTIKNLPHVETVLEQHKTLYPNLETLAQHFTINDSIMREFITQAIMGNALNRKDVADMIKRNGGTTSGGMTLEIDKPVKVFVVDIPSKRFPGEDVYTSDSFSFNGTHLHNRIKTISGAFNPVGPNLKDMLFQLNPKTGKMDYFKMSTIGRVVEQDGTTNLDQMGSEEYSLVGKRLEAIENALKEDNPYIKIVDSKTLKGDKSEYTILSYDEFMNMPIEQLVNSHREMDFIGYRSSLNAHKDISKIPLTDQSGRLSTQIMKVALLDATTQEVEEFETLISNLLQKNLGVENAEYGKGKLINALMSEEKLLKSLLESVEEHEKDFINEIFRAIQENNADESKPAITKFDDPNLKRIIEQHIASKFEKKGLKTEISGNYLHMIPDFGNKLKGMSFDENGNKVSNAEVMLPWSMFGSSKEQVMAELEELKQLEGQKNNRRYKDLNLKYNVSVVRVPASGPVSTFNAKVIDFTDGKANMAILPDDFIKASNADHDYDKVFTYRADLNEDGSVNFGSLKTKVFKALHKLIDRNVMAQGTLIDLKTDKIGVEAKRIKAELGIEDNSANVSVADNVSLNEHAADMSFGAEAIGIFAVATKMMNVFAQSKITLNKEIEFDGLKAKDFNTRSIDDLAALLQSALDLGNDPVLIETGINRTNIDVATAMLMLGYDMGQVFKVTLNKKLQADYEQMLKDSKEYGQGGMRDAIIDNNAELNFYNNIKQIASDIKKFIPILKMDSVGPSTMAQIENIDETIKQVRENKLQFNAQAVINRPLIKHQLMVAKSIEHVLKNYFVSNSPEFRKIAKDIVSLGVTNDEVTNSFFDMMSQSMLTSNIATPGLFIEKLIDKVENSITEKEVDETVQELIDMSSSNPQQFEQLMVSYKSDATLKPLYDKVMSAMDDSLDLSKNKFIQALEIELDQDNNKKIVVGRNFSKAEASLQEEIKNDFFKLPVPIQLDIVNYQLLTAGVSDKMGSIMSMLPISMKLKAMEITEKYALGILKSNPNLVKGNMILAHKEKIQKKLEKSPWLAKKFMGDFSFDQDIITFKGQALNPMLFAKGENFTKFGKEFKTVPIEQLNQAKNNC